MPPRSSAPPLTSFTSFGDLLHYLRRRARLTQLELGIAVGYSEAQISRLEQNKRLPDLTAVAALFLPALDLADEPEMAARLVELASQARHAGVAETAGVTAITMTRTVEHTTETLGALEAIPSLPAYHLERTRLLGRLRVRLETERRLALTGLPGSGKTVLAARLAQEYAGSGPVFWLTLAPGVSTSAEAVLRQVALFLLTCGQESVMPLLSVTGRANNPIALDHQLNLVAAALDQAAAASHQPPLLCLDNVELVLHDEVMIGVLRRLAATRVRLLLTSSEAIQLPGVAQVRLHGLEPDEGRALVTRLAGDLEITTWASRLLDKTDSPMLLCLATGQLLEHLSNPAAFISSLETQPQVADYLLRTVQKRLSPAGWCLASLLSILRQPINLQDELLVELSQEIKDPCPWAGAIEELQCFHLIESPGWASLHPLIRDYVYGTLSADPARRRSLHRVAAKWYEVRPGDMLEAAYHYARAGELEQVAGVIASQTDALSGSGRALAAAEIVSEALAQLERKRIENPALKRRLLVARGDLLRPTLRAAEAEADYRQALALATIPPADDRDPADMNPGGKKPGKIEDAPAVRADIARRLGLILMQRGQTLETLHLVQSAAAGLQPGNTVLLARLAAVECRAHLLLSHFDETERVARQALAWTNDFAEYLPAVADEVRARAWRTLGWVAYTRHPEGPQAMDYYRQALAAARRANLIAIVNACLTNIAITQIERGDLDGALETYTEALQTSQANGDSYATAGLLHNMAIANYLRGELELALERFEKACEIERQISDWNGLLSSENARADVLIMQGRPGEARKALERTLQTNLEQLNDTWTLGSCLCSLAEAQVLEGEPTQAEATARRLLAMEGVRENARIYTGARLALTLARLECGDLPGAQAQLAEPAPGGVGLELGLKRQLVEAVVAQIAGEVERSAELAQAAAHKAQSAGYVLYQDSGRRVEEDAWRSLDVRQRIARIYYQ